MTPPRFLPLFALALATSCGADADVAGGPPPSEHGRWGVSEAWRNGTQTHMIDVAYFEFDTAAKTLTTNFTGEEAVFEYVRDERGMTAIGNPYFERMDFETLSDSALVLAGKVTDHFFRIALVPQASRIDRTQVEPRGGGLQ